MSNVGIHFNHQQLIDVGTKLNCTSDEISKVIKASLLEERTSKYYRDFLGKSEDEKKIEFDLDAWMIATPISEILTMRSALLSKPVFTPDVPKGN